MSTTSLMCQANNGSSFSPEMKYLRDWNGTVPDSRLTMNRKNK